jgi:ATP-dependent HslUV protease ATP-binding subunit HslU
MNLPLEELTPRQIVAELDRTIVGQAAAKKAVAIALRSRWRRQQLPAEQRAEIMPKNILMIGPTGVGKTEIARRLARLAKAPFVKVEATKFTEVGYVGRDVESMVRELAAAAVRLVEEEKAVEVAEESQNAAIDQVTELILAEEWPQVFHTYWDQPSEDQPQEEEEIRNGETREEYRRRLRAEIINGDHDQRLVSVDMDEQSTPFMQVFTPQGMEELGIDTNGHNPFGGTRRVTRDLPVSEALVVLVQQESGQRISKGAIYKEAVERAEQTGIIFLDEIDKIAMKSGSGGGPDVSREGVQRDLLPVIEGSTVPSKFGPIRTDHILFIAAGAFHESKPSDLIPELQGRLPVRVELESLSEEDFRRILVEPENSLVNQYKQLLSVDGVTLTFSDDALDELAFLAQEVNRKIENIGARRLSTLMEKLLEEFMFEAPEGGPRVVEITCAEVRAILGDLVANLEKSGKIL